MTALFVGLEPSSPALINFSRYKRQYTPLDVFSLRPIKNDRVTPYVLLDHNNKIKGWEAMGVSEGG